MHIGVVCGVLYETGHSLCMASPDVIFIDDFIYIYTLKLARNGIYKPSSGRGGGKSFSTYISYHPGTLLKIFRLLTNLYNLCYTLGMRKSLEKLTRKLFSIGSKHIKIIDHFIEDGRHTSESDVVRQALMTYHDKIYPAYVFHLTPAAKEKQKKVQEEEELANRTDDEIAESLKFFPVETNDGEKMYFYRGLGRTPYVIPADSIKEWAEKPINKYEIDENYIHYNDKPPQVYFSDSIGALFCKQNNLKMPEFHQDED